MTDRSACEAGPITPTSLVRGILLLGGFVLLALLAWQLAHVLLLAFAAVLFAILLRSLTALIERFSPIKSPWSLVVAGLLIAILAAAFVLLLGMQIYSQIVSLMGQLPELISSLGDRLGIENLRERLAQRAQDFSLRTGLIGKIAGYTSTLLGALASLFVVVAAGIYLAAHPARYRGGALQLVPKRARTEAASAVDNAGRALQLWLIGRLVSMALVGILTTLGLYLIGMPSALALGFLAGILEFVPLVGPTLSAIPAILLGLTQDGTTVLWVVGLYVVVQQIEGNVIMPLVQRRAVGLPPVLTLFAILAFGILFGPLGVILATPLAVLLYVAVKQLYVRNALGEETDVPGEPE